MSRSLYRFYLYLVSSILTVIAAVGLNAISIALLEQTELRSTYSLYEYGGMVYSLGSPMPPAQGLNAQQMTLGVTLLVIAGGLLGLHYWLIRRDLATDSAAGATAIRSFFLICSRYSPR
jgi:hypothetical protein